MIFRCIGTSLGPTHAETASVASTIDQRSSLSSSPICNPITVNSLDRKNNDSHLFYLEEDRDDDQSVVLTRCCGQIWILLCVMDHVQLEGVPVTVYRVLGAPMKVHLVEDIGRRQAPALQEQRYTGKTDLHCKTEDQCFSANPLMR